MLGRAADRRHRHLGESRTSTATAGWAGLTTVDTEMAGAGTVSLEALAICRRGVRNVLAHPLVVAGQGTVALEILAEGPEIDTLLVAIGGGGLISGVAVAAKALNACRSEAACASGPAFARVSWRPRSCTSARRATGRADACSSAVLADLKTILLLPTSDLRPPTAADPEAMSEVGTSTASAAEPGQAMQREGGFPDLDPSSEIEIRQRRSRASWIRVGYPE